MLVMIALGLVLLVSIITLMGVLKMAYSFNDLENAVTAQGTVIDSLAVLLNTLTEEITTANNAGDSDAIARIIGEVQGNTDRITSAITANTPAGTPVVTPIVNPAPVTDGNGTVIAPVAPPTDADGNPITTDEPDPAVDEQNAVNQASMDNQFNETKFGDTATQVQTPNDAAVGTPPASGTTTAPVSTPADAEPAPEATPGEMGNRSNL